MVKSKHQNHIASVNINRSAPTQGQGTSTSTEACIASGASKTHNDTRAGAKAGGSPGTNTASDEGLLVMSKASAGNSWRRTASRDNSKCSGVSSPPSPLLHPHSVNVAAQPGAVSSNNRTNTNMNDSISYIGGLDVEADVSTLREDRDDSYMHDSRTYDSDYEGRTRAGRIGCFDMFCSCVEIVVELFFAFDGTNAAMHTSGGGHMGNRHESTRLRGSSEEMTRRLHNRNDRVNSSFRGRNQEHARSAGNLNSREDVPGDEGENTYVSRCPSIYPNTAVGDPLARGDNNKTSAGSTTGGAGTKSPSSPTSTRGRGSASKEQGAAVAVERTAFVGRAASSSAKPPISNLSIYLPSSPLPLTSSPTSSYPNNQSFALLNLPPRQSFYLAPNATCSTANASPRAKKPEGCREREAVVQQREASFSSSPNKSRPTTCRTTRPKDQQQRNRTESSSGNMIKCSPTQRDQNQEEIFPSPDFTSAQPKAKQSRIIGGGGTHDVEMNSKKAMPPKGVQSRKPPREEGEAETEGDTSARAFSQQPTISVASAQEIKPLMPRDGTKRVVRAESLAERRRGGASTKNKEAIFRLACEDADL